MNALPKGTRMTDPRTTRASRLAGVITIAVASLALVSNAAAHKPFLVPSTTVLSGADEWITIDAAVSDDLFFFNHQPLSLDGVAITGPDGTAIRPENVANGKVRNTFDVHVVSRGTYRITSDANFFFANYEVAGERKRWRGSAASFATEVPAGADKLEVTQNALRVETFVTSGRPTTTAFRLSGSGIELQPVTHPNDLVVGEAARFRLMLDGKPAANLKVTAMPGESRYRDRADEIATITDADGLFSFKWPVAGLWWINASTRDDRTTLPQAKERRANYAATLEVMPN